MKMPRRVSLTAFLPLHASNSHLQYARYAIAVVSSRWMELLQVSEVLFINALNEEALSVELQERLQEVRVAFQTICYTSSVGVLCLSTTLFLPALSV